MRRATLLLALVLAPAAHAHPAEPLGHAGRWIIDARGRVVVLHGFNTVPVDEKTTLRDMGMGPDNARWLARNGFNTIRLGFHYARVEPRPGVYDDAHLDGFLRVQRQLAKRRIFTLVDAHQDQLNPRFGTGFSLPSRGFPDWMIRDDGYPNTRGPYPGGYMDNPALNRAYDNLWADFAAPDGVSVQDHFAAGWQHIIRRMRTRRGILGYDLFNEPWPGSSWSSCAGATGCPEGGFDQTLLTAFTRKLVKAARAADPTRLIFYEPNLLFDFGAPTGVGDPGDRNAGFSWHNYCLSNVAGPGEDPSGACSVNEQVVFDNAEAQARRTGDALLLSEIPYGADAVRRQTAMADQMMMSWQRWDYYGDSKVPLEGRLDDLVRAYPQVVAGTPESWSFDPAAKTFELAYSTKRAEGEGAELRRGRVAPGKRFPSGARTEVFVPRRHFPKGYAVEVKGARVVSKQGAQRLVLASRRGAERVELGIRAR